MYGLHHSLHWCFWSIPSLGCLIPLLHPDKDNLSLLHVTIHFFSWRCGFPCLDYTSRRSLLILYRRCLPNLPSVGYSMGAYGQLILCLYCSYNMFNNICITCFFFPFHTMLFCPELPIKIPYMWKLSDKSNLADHLFKWHSKTSNKFKLNRTKQFKMLDCFVCLHLITVAVCQVIFHGSKFFFFYCSLSYALCQLEEEGGKWIMW